MEIPLRTEYLPRTIDSQADVEVPIREALAAAQDRGTVTVDLPGATLTLTWCDFPDRTPIWDHPLPESLGKVAARRPDGVEAVWSMWQVPTWKALTQELIDFQADWAREVMEALSEARAWVLREKLLKAELQKARSRRTQAMIRAEKAGVTRHRIGQVTEITGAGVKKILDSHTGGR